MRWNVECWMWVGLIKHWQYMAIYHLLFCFWVFLCLFVFHDTWVKEWKKKYYREFLLGEMKSLIPCFCVKCTVHEYICEPEICYIRDDIRKTRFRLEREQQIWFFLHQIRKMVKSNKGLSTFFAETQTSKIIRPIEQILLLPSLFLIHFLIYKW